MENRIAVIGRELLFDGFLKLARYRLSMEPGVGERAMLFSRERVEGLHSAAVLPFDPVHESIVLVEQFRIGAFERGRALSVQEPPGGVILAGRSAEDTARREAREEAGCSIGRMVAIGCCRTSAGFSDERVELFCGEVDATGLPEFGGVRAEGEHTRVVIRDLDSAICELGQGSLSAATVMIAVQWLALNRERVREAWAGNSGKR